MEVSKDKEKGIEDLAQPDQSQGHKSLITVKTCPVELVTVYNDRAEVTRRVTVDILPGSNEVRVFGLSSKIDRDSVRVSGGKGNAVILEVQYNKRWESKTEDNSQLGQLKKEQEELTDKIARNEELLGRLEKEKEWVTNWAQSLSNPSSKKNKEIAFSAEAIEQATKFLEYYQHKLADIDERKFVTSHSNKELREQLVRVNKTIGESSRGDREEVHEVIILISAEEKVTVELLLSYVVTGASWKASYDVRVISGNTSLDLTYYGSITNNSLDDWNNARLELSTAKPSVGGAPPELTTKFIGIRPVQYRHQSRRNAAYTNFAYTQAEVSSAWAPVLEAMDEGISEDNDYGGNSAPMVMTSEVKESSICTSFAIPRATTILSDNSPHKVTIRIINLEANFTYLVMPKLSDHAYLKASITNTSENYPFLPGEINVFMDGNFIAKSSIKSVSPQESFSLFLGADDSVKVTYPPGVHFKEMMGLIRKSNLKTMKYAATIKNTKNTPISITVFDQLPKSNDSQIKVKLITPVISDDVSNITLTKANNVKWQYDIGPGKQKVIPFEYQVEWPSGVDVTDF